MINGKPYRSYGYNIPQYQTLQSLIQVLAGALGGVDMAFPKDVSGAAAYDYKDAYEAFHGVVAHWHLTPRRWDPGPGFDWEMLTELLHGNPPPALKPTNP